jgi:hypothetical protein
LAKEGNWFVEIFLPKKLQNGDWKDWISRFKNLLDVLNSRIYICFFIFYVLFHGLLLTNSCHDELFKMTNCLICLIFKMTNCFHLFS